LNDKSDKGVASRKTTKLSFKWLFFSQFQLSISYDFHFVEL